MKAGTQTINLKASTAQKLFIDAQQKVVLEEKIIKLNEDIANYDSAIISLKTVIKAMEAKDTIENALIDSYKREISALNSQKADYESMVSSLEKQLRKANRKSKLTAFAGILAVIASGYLYVMK